MQLIIESAARLNDYQRVSIAFEVTERLDIGSLDVGARGFRLPVRTVNPPFVKDYDAQLGQRPAEWATRFDLSKWWFAAAFLDGRRVGGAAVIVDASEPAAATPIAGPADAVLWDIRVEPTCRRRGVGRQLLEFAESHARAHGSRAMLAETQDINVPACRFYARSGYVLSEVNRGAYAELPDEAQLIWRKDLI